MQKRTALLSWGWFFSHALIEFICFAVLFRCFPGNPSIAFIAALLYDSLAFVPQGLIGELMEHFPRLDIGTIGAAALGAGLLLCCIGGAAAYPGLIVLALGNAALHEAGAITTTLHSHGKLFPAALFVSGGSFGLIIGQTYGRGSGSLLWLCIPAVLILAYCILTRRSYVTVERTYPVFSLTQENRGFYTILLVTLLVVTARSFLGYAIPISWKKETWQAFLLFFIMGFGKAVGGWLADRFGAKRVGICSTLLCIPFLIVGSNQMVISCIGVFLFSLTMSITFGMALSILPKHPGLAFGVTTLGLFLGIVPIFLFGTIGFTADCICIVVLSIASAAGLYLTLK